MQYHNESVLKKYAPKLKIGTVKEYMAQFNVIAAHTSFGDEDKHEQYCASLPYKIRDAFAIGSHSIVMLE